MASAELLDRRFVLASDIDASGTGNWNCDGDTCAGFKPIGDAANPFAGSLDGGGYEIAGLVISRPEDDDVGLFGFTGETSSIVNLILSGAVVHGKNRVGSLVGNSQGSVSDVSATAVQVVGGTVVGGLLGANAGSVARAWAAGQVTGDETVGGFVGHNQSQGSMSWVSFEGGVSGGSVVGGLAGRSDGSVSLAYALGAVTGTSYVGGLAGQLAGSSEVSQVYFSGAVEGSEWVGGLAGELSATLSDAYAAGSVTGTMNVGGLVGELTGASVRRTYTTSVVSGSASVGGLIGKNAGGDVIASFFATTPLLRVLLAPLTVEVFDRDETYDGNTYGGTG